MTMPSSRAVAVFYWVWPALIVVLWVLLSGTVIIDPPPGVTYDAGISVREAAMVVALALLPPALVFLWRRHRGRRTSRAAA